LFTPDTARGYSPQDNAARMLDRWAAGLPIAVLVLADLLENWGVLRGLSQGGYSADVLIPWIQALGAIRSAALGSLLVYLLLAAGLRLRR
jgi:hypothetical protein